MAVLYHQGQFPPGALDWPQLLPLIGPANAAVARYEGVLHGIPNPNVLLSPLTTQEAVLSSRIEGTQATIGEVLEFEAEGQPGDESTPKKADIHEVLNYRAALAEASRLLETLPLSQRLIRLTHARLMQGVRGRNKDPGEYRRIPNWIGPEGCTIEQARFVPCSAEALPGAMDAWERYIHDPAPDALIQLAVLHAEFEAIHPFLDGNGRLGRLIIPLFLKSKGLLSAPNFYLSEYLESHRDEYYDRLLAVSRDGDCAGVRKSRAARPGGDKGWALNWCRHRQKNPARSNTLGAQGICISAVEVARKETKMFDTRLTQIELAARWRISHRTLEYWRSLGEGPRFIKIGRLVIYRMEDVVAFENRELSEIAPDKTGG